ncbi:MAG: hypothetical protein IKM59_07215 [Oscillospiraceae bacterium]|nr:hypothetical protein [Oscillospiraceae bacterium]
MGCKEEDLQALLPRPLPREAVGRLITGQEWYFAVPGSFPEIEMGSTLTLIIEGQSCEAQVLRTRELLLLKSTDYCHRITDLRRAEAVVQTGSFSAIPLPGKALYWEDGESYVYLLQGAQVRRRTVQVLRIDGDTLWISTEDLPEGARVILTEIELTDGMVLK